MPKKQIGKKRPRAGSKPHGGKSVLNAGMVDSPNEPQMLRTIKRWNFFARRNAWRHSFISNLHNKEWVLYGLPQGFGDQCAANLNELSFPSPLPQTPIRTLRPRSRRAWKHRPLAPLLGVLGRQRVILGSAFGSWRTRLALKVAT
jgi:hypothetical protein